jgi:hypothetical protein
VISVVPTASAPNMSARWLMDLSPATPAWPESGAVGLLARKGRGAAVDMGGV